MTQFPILQPTPLDKFCTENLGWEKRENRERDWEKITAKFV